MTIFSRSLCSICRFIDPSLCIEEARQIPIGSSVDIYAKYRGRGCSECSDGHRVGSLTRRRGKSSLIWEAKFAARAKDIKC